MFGGEKIQRLEKWVQHTDTMETALTLSVGKGKILYCGLPLELADNHDTLENLYVKACELA